MGIGIGQEIRIAIGVSLKLGRGKETNISQDWVGN